MAPSGSWMVLSGSPPIPSPALVASTTRAALSFASGGVGSGLATASAVALSRGVLRMMMLSKLKVGLAVVLSTGFVAGSGMIAAQGPGGAAAPPPAKVVDRAEDARPGEGDLAALGRSRVEMARKRLKTQSAYYEEGRITMDRVLDALQTLMDAELDVATTPAERKAAIRTHLDRIREIERHEKAELEGGRATDADVEKAQTRRLDIEYRLAKEETAAVPSKGPPGTPPAVAVPADPSVVDKLTRERVEIARRLLDQAQRLFSAGEISVNEVLNASATLMQAERDAAGTKAECEAAIRAVVENLKKIVAVEEEQVKRGLASRPDVEKARLRLLDAEIELARETAGSGPSSVADLERRVVDVERKLDRLLNLLNDLKR
jgi:hypothetical protein